jgi:TolB protein
MDDMRRIGLLCLVGALAGAACGPTDGAADVLDPRAAATARSSADATGKIVFTRFSQDGGIMTMNSDGTDVRTVADGDHHALGQPAWSPDGSKIAFHGFFGEAANEAGGLFVMNADGSGRKLLDLGGTTPAWSPNGRWIAYENHGTIQLIASEGSDPTNASAGLHEAEDPSWSPDGTTVAYGGCCAAGYEIYIVSPDGTDLTQVTDEPDDGASGSFSPAWSPDGLAITHKRIRYDSATETDSEALYIMETDGAGVTRVTGEFFFDGPPMWSPAGTHIAFAARVGSGDPTSVFVMTIEGEELWELSDGTSPTWSPDSTRIAFERIEGDASHIYSINIDGTDLQQLTFGPHGDHSPDWTAAPADSSAAEPPRSSVQAGGAPDCGMTNIASDDYGTEIHPTSGPPGTEVSFSGTTVRGEDWRWAPSDRLEAWWDTDVPWGGIRLVRVDDMERCRFETTFTVPDVEPGGYTISVFTWFANPDEGYGLFLPHRFAVTDN